ncbi:MAG: DUF3102 domain-containing protein [Chloroflexi bacterium]|nr:MAG: DUF3102 domain-containing protein [Chloroflexota bacterium]
MSQLTLFDYNSLDAETRIVVQQRTGEIRDLVRRTAENVVRIGGKLAEVRDRLGNSGRFDAWLQAEFEWSRRTAYNFISVYERFGTRANFAQMDIATSALYLLASPSTPPAAVEEALERAESGERITPAAAKEIIQEHKARMSPELPMSEPDDEPEDASPEPPRREPPPLPSYARPQPQPEPDDGITLDFSTPAAAAEPDAPADIILTIRLKRSGPTQIDAAELEINAEDGLLRGRFPDFHAGDYADLPALVRRAIDEYLQSEEIISNE